MKHLNFTWRECAVALLAAMAILLFGSEANSVEAFIWSKGIAILLGLGAYVLGRNIKIEEQ